MIENLVWFALCIYFEARGEIVTGQIAVGHVIMNRVEKSGTSVKEVVTKPWQFSWLNNGARPPITDYEALMDCIFAAYICLEQRLEGKNLWGADHYYNPAKANPGWGKLFKEVKVIGNHRFMKS